MARFVKAAKVGEVPQGRTKVVELGRERIVLCNVEGRFYAISDVCTHDEGPLGEGELRGEIIECPRHGAQFNVKTGEVAAPPAFEPVPTYPVRVQGSDVEVAVNGI